MTEDIEGKWVAEVAARFEKDTERHKLVWLLRHGVHRHVRFAKPGTGIDAFEVVTWPGYLCFCGDRGDFVFERIEDMVHFAWKGDKSSFGYLAEKCVAACRDGIDEWSPELAMESLREQLAEDKAEFEQESDKSASLRNRISGLEEIVADGVDCEDGVRAAANELGLWEDEWPGFRIYTGRFIWAVLGISKVVALIRELEGPPADEEKADG